MESFRQHIWTTYQPVMGELPTIENAVEPLEWPDMDGSFTDIPMANYPRPPLIAERNAAPPMSILTMVYQNKLMDLM